MTTTAPVVWISNPNSEDDKPTAFALQGIKLEGNVSEQHVLAVRELVNAAAKGKLLLPGDGQIVLLNCGLGVGSLILQDNNNKENNINIDTKNITEIYNKYDELYQFLCCARCMERGKKFCTQNVKMFEKCVHNFTSRTTTGGGSARPYTKRRKNVKFKRDPCANRRILSSSTYATVNKQQKKSHSKNLQSNAVINATTMQQTISDISEIGRKTSFDSTCTVSSMDSGFMEMQNKLDSIEKSVVTCNKNKTAVAAATEDQAISANKSLNEIRENKASWNFLSIPTQSKNRRKSYEEFKLMFKEPKTENYERIGDKKSSITTPLRSRRHSIDEKNNVVIQTVTKGDIKSASSDHLDRKFQIPDDVVDSTNNSSNNLSSRFSFKLNRRNSKHKFERKNATIVDSEFPKKVSSTSFSVSGNSNELKDQNNKLKDFEKLISCGTIYDIIQKKNEFYSRNFKKYDKYMTYGTLYEILHRKFDEIEDIDRKSTLSQKKANIEFDSYHENHYKTVTAATDTNSSKTLHSTCISSSANPMKQGSNISNNQLSIAASITTQQLSTIYDILQNKTSTTPPKKERTRFLVQRITEEDLMASQENGGGASSGDVAEVKENVIDDANAKSGNKEQVKRSRRFSNILSNHPSKLEMLSKQQTSTDVNIAKLSDKQIQLEYKIDELYTRLNRIGRINNENDSSLLQQNQQQHHKKTENENSKMFKSSSMGILNASESETNNVVVNSFHPLRKISVPSQKPPVFLPKKATRRLSEFTRGEFLNEKS